MLLDAHALQAESVLQTDFCVIGSGMGGAAVAHALARAHREVLLVEAGGADKPSSTDLPLIYENTGRKFGLPITRSIELGGTSEWWHGICSPLDEIDFETRPWIEGSGWPIRRHHLDPFYRQATAQLGLGSAYDVDGQSLPLACRPRLKDIGFNSSLLEPKVFQFKEPAVRWKGLLTELAQAGKLRCIINAPALELIVNDEGNVVSELIVGAGSSTATVRANVFVICAGALETPRLLLNSRRRLPAGIGNDRGLVGSNLLDHPMGHFSKLRFRRPVKAPLYTSMRLEESQQYFVGLTLAHAQQESRGLANHCLWIRPSATRARVDDRLLLSFLGVKKVRDLSLQQIIGVLRNRDIQNRILAKCFGFQASYIFGDLFFMTEQLPNAASRVDLSQTHRDRFGYPIARVNWQISDADIEGFDRYSQMVLKEGLVSDQYGLARHDPIAEWSRCMSSAAHHLGTAKMGSDPQNGVVNLDLQVFGINNLFIADGSVFPTTGNANPSLTIIALALRLAESLMKKSKTQRAS